MAIQSTGTDDEVALSAALIESLQFTMERFGFVESGGRRQRDPIRTRRRRVR